MILFLAFGAVIFLLVRPALGNSMHAYTSVIGGTSFIIGHLYNWNWCRTCPVCRASNAVCEVSLNKSGGTYLTEDAESLIKADGIELLVEATGNPSVGIRYALQAIEYGRHIIMVNVEADVLAGHLLAQESCRCRCCLQSRLW